MTDVGELNQEVRLQVRHSTPKVGVAGVVEEWETIKGASRVWAKVHVLSAVRRAESQNAGPSQTPTHRFTIRHREGLGASTWIVWKGRRYQVLTVGAPKDEVGRFTDLVAREDREVAAA